MMAQTTDQSHAVETQGNYLENVSLTAPAFKKPTQQGTLQTIEKTTSEKVITNSDWLSVSVTLWPIVAVIFLVLFYKQVASVLQNLHGLTFGSFSLKLRRRMSRVEPQDKFEKLKSLNARDLKFFFVLGSQSWKITSVTWSYDIEENLRIHEKLEEAGLLVIKNKATAINDKNVVASLTDVGEQLYEELTSLISESL